MQSNATRGHHVQRPPDLQSSGCRRHLCGSPCPGLCAGEPRWVEGTLPPGPQEARRWVLKACDVTGGLFHEKPLPGGSRRGTEHARPPGLRVMCRWFCWGDPGRLGGLHSSCLLCSPFTASLAFLSSHRSPIYFTYVCICLCDLRVQIIRWAICVIYWE